MTIGAREFRYAARSLVKSPGFSLVAVLTLAVGIGAVTALFTVVDGVLLKPLRYADPDRIVSILNRYHDRAAIVNLSGGDEIDIAAEPRLFEAVAYYHGGEMGVQLGDHAEFVGVRLVHPDFFDVFGMTPVAGRPFNRDDAQRSAIVGVAFANRNFGGAASAVGKSVFIENRSYEIVGVMPAQMQFPATTDVWAAAALAPENRNRSGHNYRAVAKLAPDVSLAVANDRLRDLAARLAVAFPDSNRDKTFLAMPLRDALVTQARTTLYVLMGAVLLVLLIACANVANLMLARASDRTNEMAVRTALGASRTHIVAQLLIESLVIASVAAALGLVLAAAGVRALAALGAVYAPLPRLGDVHVDWRVLLFSVGACVLTAVGFGLAPAIQASQAPVTSALKQGSARGALGGASNRMRNVLAAAQIALSFMLAINAGLLLRSFVLLGQTPLGFDRAGVLVMYAHAPARGSIFDKSGLANYLQVGQTFDELLGRMRALPEVIAAGAVMGLPTGQYESNGSYAVEGMHTFGGDFRALPSAGFRLASPGYFDALRIPLKRGREFNDGDLYDRPFVAIISESLARQTFGDQDPIGRRIMCGFDQPDAWMTVVGIVGDVRQASPAAQPGPELYMPLRQHPYAANEVQIVLRTRGAPESLVGAVQRLVRSQNPDVAMKFTTLEASVDNSIAASRFRTTLASTFAWFALLLAGAGVYSVMTYTTARRTAEFGLRFALGARPGDVMRLVLARAGRITLVGAAIGLALALSVSRVLETMLFGITSTDPTTYLMALLLAMPLIAAAAAIPAWRAARLDPVTALKAE